jgi:hypothetical protein
LRLSAFPKIAAGAANVELAREAKVFCFFSSEKKTSCLAFLTHDQVQEPYAARGVSAPSIT